MKLIFNKKTIYKLNLYKFYNKPNWIKSKRNIIYNDKININKQLSIYYNVTPSYINIQSNKLNNRIFNKDLNKILLLSLLNMRLDNILYKSGFTLSIKNARQLISHGHVYINNNILKYPNYICKINDIIWLKSSDSFRKVINKSILYNLNNSFKSPDFLKICFKNLFIKVIAIISPNNIVKLWVKN
uniref:Ribosomal protein S4 n=1 Tax=Piridium sociabile TaxID=2570542 RepID=A0A5B9XVM5_9ALVE|nr:ribosomal protein S4 [Piridium sociabile]